MNFVLRCVAVLWPPLGSAELVGWPGLLEQARCTCIPWQWSLVALVGVAENSMNMCGSGTVSSKKV